MKKLNTYSVAPIAQLVACGLLSFSTLTVADTSPGNYAESHHPSGYPITEAESELSIKEMIDAAVALLGPPDVVQAPPSLLQSADPVIWIDYLANDLDRITEWLESSSETLEIIAKGGNEQNGDVQKLARAYYDVLNHIEHTLRMHAEIDASAALAVAQASSSVDTNSMLTHGVLHTWSTLNPEAALDWVMAVGDPMLEEQYRFTVIYRWMSKDPESALLAIQSLPRDTNTAYYLSDYAVQMVQSDPYAAYLWADALPNNEDRLLAISRLSNEWAYNDSENFLHFVSSLPLDLQSQLIRENSTTIVSQKVYQDPMGALTWADSLGKDDRNIARQVAFTTWFYEDAETALSQSQQLLDDVEYENFMLSMAYELPRYDFDYALDVFNRSNHSIRSAMVYSLIEPMVQTDIDSAIEWVAQLPRDSGEKRTHSLATLGLVQNLTIDHPELAMEHLLAYHGENREDVLREGFWNIAVQRLPFAKQSIDNLELTEEESTLFNEILGNAEEFNGGHGC